MSAVLARRLRPSPEIWSAGSGAPPTGASAMLDSDPPTLRDCAVAGRSRLLRRADRRGDPVVLAVLVVVRRLEEEAHAHQPRIGGHVSERWARGRDLQTLGLRR